MKKHPHTSPFRFDIHVTGAENGFLVEAPVVANGGVNLDMTVCATKEALLTLIEKRIDDFYKA